MVHILYKDCCYDCGYVDIDYDRIGNTGSIDLLIFCPHMYVCKRYQEEKEEAKQRYKCNAEQNGSPCSTCKYHTMIPEPLSAECNICREYECAQDDGEISNCAKCKWQPREVQE